MESDKLWLIELFGAAYVFGGKDLTESGFIATIRQYQNFEESFAHYHANGYPDLSDGFISRYGEGIGTAKDITLVKQIEVSPTEQGQKRNIDLMLAGLDFPPDEE